MQPLTWVFYRDINSIIWLSNDECMTCHVRRKYLIIAWLNVTFIGVRHLYVIKLWLQLILKTCSSTWLEWYYPGTCFFSKRSWFKLTRIDFYSYLVCDKHRNLTLAMYFLWLVDDCKSCWMDCPWLKLTSYICIIDFWTFTSEVNL